MSEARDYKSELNVLCQGCDFKMPVYSDKLLATPKGEPGWSATLEVAGLKFCSRNRKRAFKTKLAAEQCAAELALWRLGKLIEPDSDSGSYDGAQCVFGAKVFAQNKSSVKARVEGDAGVVTISGACASGIKTGQRIVVSVERSS